MKRKWRASVESRDLNVQRAGEKRVDDAVMIERAVAIFGMLFWFAFPIGMIISVIRQDHDAHHGHSSDVSPDHESAFGPDYKKSA